MKIYTITRSHNTGTYYTYFGVVSKKRVGFKNEHIVGIRTFNEKHELVGGKNKSIFGIEDAREKWHDKSIGTFESSVVINSIGADVLTPNGREPKMDYEVIKAIDKYDRSIIH